MKYSSYGANLFNQKILKQVIERINYLDRAEQSSAQLSCKNFYESFVCLHDRYNDLMLVEKDLCDSNPDNKNESLSRLQLDFLKTTEAFHQQIYSTMSAFVKLLALITPPGYIKKRHFISNKKFVDDTVEYVRKEDEYDNIKQSFKYRGGYVVHTKRNKHFTWMSFTIGRVAYLIYYNPIIEKDLKSLDLSQFLDENLRLHFGANLPLEAQYYFITPNHSLVYFEFYDFIIDVLTYFN